MIRVSYIADSYQKAYDFVYCPICKKGRLCDKPRAAAVSFEKIPVGAHVVLKCPKCGSHFAVSTVR